MNDAYQKKQKENINKISHLENELSQAKKMPPKQTAPSYDHKSDIANLN
jgi:hypothetical protein